jgi:hypothetical protein
MRDSVTVTMAAPIEKVWALVSDVTRIGEFSPETFDAEWLGDATGPAVGARFRGHVKRNRKGPVYWSLCVVDVCDPPADGRAEFTFTVMIGERRVNTWSYALRSLDGGTEVTESFALAPTLPLRVYWALLGRARGRTNREGMRTTLERMRAVVEA